MQTLASAYHRLLVGLAALGAMVLALVFVGIVLDVSLRTAGFQPIQWYSAVAEYSLLFVTMLGAPWLVRIKGHVVVQSLTLALPRWLRIVVEKLAYLLCIALSLMFAWYGGEKAIQAFVSGEVDLRSIDMPRWILYALFPLGFGLISIEFLRYLIGIDTYYAGKAGSSDSL